MMKIRVLEKVKAFPFDGYRHVAEYNDVEFITSEYYHEDGQNHSYIEYFCLHLKNGNTATFNTVDYIMEFM